MMNKNFHLFHDFFDVFNNAFHLFVVPSDEVDIVKVLQEKQNYRMFIYERPLPQYRGLQPYDDNGLSLPFPESEMSDASSEEECTKVSQQNLIKIKLKKKDDVISRLRKKYVKGNISFAEALNKKINNATKAHRKGEIDGVRRQGVSGPAGVDQLRP